MPVHPDEHERIGADRIVLGFDQAATETLLRLILSAYTMPDNRLYMMRLVSQAPDP